MRKFVRIYSVDLAEIWREGRKYPGITREFNHRRGGLTQGYFLYKKRIVLFFFFSVFCRFVGNPGDSASMYYGIYMCNY